MFSRLRQWTSSRTLSAPARLFSQTPIVPAKPLPPRLKINDADISISYLKGTGPGGQKIVRFKSQSHSQTMHPPLPYLFPDPMAIPNQQTETNKT